ncbi:MAG: NUDIX hydrolase [Bacteroidota bacterium]
MQLDSIIPLLERYKPVFEEESLYRKLMSAWAISNPDTFWQRSLLEGHFTGSAWVLNPDRSKALLIHHRGLNKWFQPGGHAEETDISLLETARREAQEECGLSALEVLENAIFDLDIHIIPAKKDIPEHLHYDVRFLFQADSEILQGDEEELSDLAWVSLKELSKRDLQQSVRRMVLKCNIL